MKLYDISVPITEEMPIYHDNPGFGIELASAIARGDGANVSELRMGAHTGTHVDGPSHFYDGRAGTEMLPVEPMIGPCAVVEIAEPGAAIDRGTLEGAGVPGGVRRLLLKTPNSKLWVRSEFTGEFVRLDESGAEWILERGVELIGIDYLSIGDADAHRALLAANVVALEGLDLRAVEPGPYTLVCLPLRLVGSDGAPARAVLIEGAIG
ncbi:MAG: cyclase family protein [Solirubrobacterales bacterium]